MQPAKIFLSTLVYSSVFVAVISSFLSVIPLLILNKDILIYKICLIFSGTLFVYNYDHLQDIKYDRKTNPQRTRYILENKKLLRILKLASGLLSIYLFLFYNLYENLVLVPALFFGLLHWKFKVRRFLSAVYITLSWVLVVVIFPLSPNMELNSVNLFIISVFGLTFLGNAVVFMTDDTGAENKRLSFLLSKIAVITAIILCLLSPGTIKHLFFIPAMTLLAIIKYPDDETFKLLYLDGALLFGGIISLLAHQIMIHHFH